MSEVRTIPDSSIGHSRSPELHSVEAQSLAVAGLHRLKHWLIVVGDAGLAVRRAAITLVGLRAVGGAARGQA